MGVVLTILKWIGILILVLILLILLLILTVLIARIKYHVKGSYREETPDGDVAVSFLPVKVRAGYHGGALSWRASVFGKTVAKSSAEPEEKEEEKKEKRPAEAPAAVKEEGNRPGDKAEPDGEKRPEKESEKKPENAPKPPEPEVITTEQESAFSPELPLPEEGPEAEKKSLTDRLNELAEKLAEFLNGLEDKLDRADDRISDLDDKKDRILEELDDERNREMLRLIFRQIGKMLRHILPQKYKANVRFGMEDPAKTGQILGIVSMFYPVFAGNADIQPDFEKKILEGDADIRGRIRLGSLLCMAFRILLNKRVRYWIKFALNMKKNKSAGPEEVISND